MTHHRADAIMRAYCAVRDRRFVIRAPQLSITGSVSDCCGTTTFASKGDRRCYRCRRPCGEKTWHSKAGGTGDTRGGWNPLRRRGTENQIYSNPTRTVDRGGEDRRRAEGIDEFKALQDLVGTPARHLTASEWEDRLRAWELLLSPDVPGMAGVAERGGHGWTVEGVTAWILEARRVVTQRIVKHPGRYPGLGRSGSRMSAV